MIQIKSGDIANAETDIIVNAANGCGYMGGIQARKTLCKGVAEHLNYYSHGEIEKEARIVSRRFPNVSSWILGKKAGEIYITSPHGLKCKKIIHAVTMRYPGCKSNIFTVKEIVEKVFKTTIELQYM